MLDPLGFKLLGRLIVLAFKIVGLFTALVVQTVWYCTFRREFKVGDALGDFIRGVTDAVGNVFAGKE